VVEDGGHSVPIFSSVLPQIDAAVGYNAAGMRQASEPMHRVDLVDHPLVGNSRGVRPEQAELEMFASVEAFARTIDQEALPVGVRFAELRHQLGTAPAPWLVHVPRHFDGNNVAKLA